MTYESEDVRHEFHKLPTALQFEIELIAEQLAQRLIFIHVDGVTRDSEVVFRINKKLIARPPTDD